MKEYVVQIVVYEQTNKDTEQEQMEMVEVFDVKQFRTEKKALEFARELKQKGQTL